MRLEKIKLSGFKSFVDPTVLELRSSLVAVVGPNGCGKSNIIDAIRWVMGESSAKNLRGESMSDVIFNGSSARKPVGQASIELVFDNSDGSLGGEYARFSEISVRRQATRDGDSTYFLNNTRCRRKDITDIFLGTGLGPRSYAIIEQGMISRVIEAKPEELRAFLEEAAGIALYRKRRQETEVRMRHTRENLDRLNDLKQEVEKQLERLARQSQAAQRYKEYQATHHRLEAELSALRWRVFDEQEKTHAQEIRTLTNQLEEKHALRASIDLSLQKLRILHTEKIDAWKSVQSHFYDLGTQIARFEQTLQHHRERRETLEKERLQAEAHYQQNLRQIEQDEGRYSELKTALSAIKPNSEASQKALKEAEQVLLKAQEAIQYWSQGFEQFQQEAHKPQRSAEVEKARIEQLEKQSRDAKCQIDRLQKEYSSIDLTSAEQQLLSLEQQKLTQEAGSHTILSELQQLKAKIVEAQEHVMTDSQSLDDCRSRLQTFKGRLASLEALQQAALGKTNALTQAWLAANDLTDASRLIDALSVEPGFERALETVLGSALEAVCVPSISAIAAMTDDLKDNHLILLEGAAPLKMGNTHIHAESSGQWLLDKVQCTVDMTPLLSGVWVVDELSEALLKRSALLPGESVITKSGVWLGQNWLKIYRGTEGHTGVLAREAELKALVENIATVQAQTLALEQSLRDYRGTIASLESKRDILQQNQQTQARAVNQLSSEITVARNRIEQFKNRAFQLEADSIEQTQKADLAEEEIALARMRLQVALDEIAHFNAKRIALQTERNALQELLHNANHEKNAAQTAAHALALQEQAYVTQQQAMEQGLQRLVVQKNTLQERCSALQSELENLKAPERDIRSQLEILLEKRLTAENSLTLARVELDELEQTLQVQETQRSLIEEATTAIRSQLETTRLARQAIEVRAQTLQEKLLTLGVTIEQILETLPPEAKESEYENHLDEVTKRIDRLGPINLAAIEEYQSESERKAYLDSQHQDLTEALDTLENAIRKIDKETRVRFKETFDKVNSEFQSLFPALFGGGEASLELKGEDLLDAGIAVMARPPGKRNSSIHLLSGGEKALTAVAMVFAIFQLNPAPFCLLDEVDAPLDDANVGRFCTLVKRLSDSVQFIFVTHNKLAMEMAHHLVGVTMKEPGVSRLVSVDIEEAAALVAHA